MKIVFRARFERLSITVGRDGRLRQRMSLPGAIGQWAAKVESINTLIDDLVRPTAEIARTIGAVAKGDLGQSMELEADGRGLKGEFLRSAKLVNTMIEQLSVFTSEVTRVAREVGTEGKLGGQAQVKGVSGVWKTSRIPSIRWPETSLLKCATLPRLRSRSRTAISPKRSQSSARRDSAAEGGHQYDGRSAPIVRLRGDPRGP